MNALARIPALAVLVAGLGFVSVRANTILIDFGNSEFAMPGATTPSPDGNGNYWNNFTDGGNAGNPTGPELIDTTGADSGIALTINGYGGSNGTGYQAGAIGIYPSTATIDSYYLALGTTGTVTLTGLNPSIAYTFKVLSSRGVSASSPRSSTFTFVGANSGSTPLIDATGGGSANGNGTIYTVSGIFPDFSNTIVMSEIPDAGDVAFGGYFNLLEIDYSVPEPSAWSLGAMGLLGLFAMIRYRRQSARV